MKSSVVDAVSTELCGWYRSRVMWLIQIKGCVFNGWGECVWYRKLKSCMFDTDEEFLHILNTGSARHLQELHTVGAKRARLIFDWRQTHGNFTSVSTLHGGWWGIWWAAYVLHFHHKVLSMKYSNVQVSTDFDEFCPVLQLSLTCTHFHAQCSCVTAGWGLYSSSSHEKPC